jgi:CRISPR system Cascade subunit CasE
MQSRSLPDWSAVSSNGWLLKQDPPIDLKQRLKLDSLEPGGKFRFRLRANPSIKRNGKRIGLFRREEQEAWLMRMAKLHGFSLPLIPCGDFYQQTMEKPAVSVAQEQMLTGKQHKGNVIRVYSALFDGVLMVREPSLFTAALQNGVGHGKVMGLGMLSVIPVP